MTLREQITQAVARGWCHAKNSHKEMDADLAEAIIDEVFKEIRPFSQTSDEPAHWGGK